MSNPNLSRFSRVMASNTLGSKISGVIATADGKILSSNNEYRRYRSDVTTRSKMRGNSDSSTKSILFEVGRRGAAGVGLSKWVDDVPAGDCSIQVSVMMAADFAGMARKYANFTGDFGVMDLASVVERLAAGIAHYATHGELTDVQLRGGGNVSVVALGASTQPIAASRDKVFLPRCVDHLTSPNTFAAIINAVSGEGGTVVTDVLEVDAHTSQIIVPSVAGVTLAEGCYHALRIIGSNYEQYQAGDVFSYAFARGVHKVVSVVAHTDEGGYFRSVLRAGRFGVPFGGIDTRLRSYSGVPRPVSGTVASFQQLVDSIALGSAGAVAMCDPLVSIEGRLYPSVFSVQDSLDRAGLATTGVDNDSKVLSARIAESCAPFVGMYVDALNELFCISGVSEVASRHLEMCFSLRAGCVDRHLKFKAVAPFFWIEPTSVVHFGDSKYKALEAGFAQLCEPGRGNALPMFEGVNAKDIGGGLIGMTCMWRSARTSGLVCHLNGHRQDGLANFVLRRGDVENFALVGGESVSVMDRMVQNRDLASYLWGRGQSCLPAPAEMLYSGNALSFVVKTGAFDDTNFTYVDTHVPVLDEIMSASVEITCTRLVVMASGRISTFTRSINRSRSAAAAAISNARLSNVNSMMCDEFSVSFSDVCLNPDARVLVASEQSAVRDELQTGSTTVERAEVSDVHQSVDTVRGERAGVVVHENAVNGPRPGSVRTDISVPTAASDVNSGSAAEAVQ
uniref:Coat protein n=1 Tax=Mucor hiemalis virus 3 TaxID=2805803 RepID=A0A8J9X1V8_9VIRU|nr:coat protein [Mucor hiemalis virus 3]